MADVNGEGETVDESHLNVIVDFIPEDYGDDLELNQDNVLVQEIKQNSNPSTEPKASLGKSRINEIKDPEDEVKQQPKHDCYNPCAYADTDSMISLPFLAGGEKYLPDAFKAIATAGKNLLNSFQQYIYEEECDAFMDSNDYQNPNGNYQKDMGPSLDRPKSQGKNPQGNQQNMRKQPGERRLGDEGKRGTSGEGARQSADDRKLRISGKGEQRTLAEGERRTSGENKDAQNEKGNKLRESEVEDGGRGGRSSMPGANSKDRRKSKEGYGNGKDERAEITEKSQRDNEDGNQKDNSQSKKAKQEKTDLRRVKSQESQTDEVGQFDPSTEKENEGYDDTKSDKAPRKSKEMENERGQMSDRAPKKSKEKQRDEDEPSDRARGNSKEMPTKEGGKAEKPGGNFQKFEKLDSQRLQRSASKESQTDEADMQMEEGEKSRPKSSERRSEDKRRDMSAERKTAGDSDADRNPKPEMEQERPSSQRRKSKERGRDEEREGARQSAEEGKRGTSREGERRTSGEGQRRTSGEGQRRSADEGKRGTSGEGQRRSVDKGKRGTSGEGERLQSKESQTDEADRNPEPEMEQEKPSSQRRKSKERGRDDKNERSSKMDEKPDKRHVKITMEENDVEEKEPCVSSVEKTDKSSQYIYEDEGESALIKEKRAKSRDRSGDEGEMVQKVDQSSQCINNGAGENEPGAPIKEKRAKSTDRSGDNEEEMVLKVDKSSQCIYEGAGMNEPGALSKEKRRKSKEKPNEEEEEQPRRRKSKDKNKNDEEDAERRRRKQEEEQRQQVAEQKQKDEEERAERRRRRSEERRQNEADAEQKRREEEKAKRQQMRSPEPRRQSAEERRKAKAEKEYEEEAEDEDMADKRRKSSEAKRQREERTTKRKDRNSKEYEMKNETRRQVYESQSSDGDRKIIVITEVDDGEELRRKQKNEEERAERRRKRSEERRQNEADAEQKWREEEKANPEKMASAEPRHLSAEERRKSKAEKQYEEEAEDEAMADKQRKSSEAKRQREERMAKRKDRNSKDDEEENDTQREVYNSQYTAEDRNMIDITEDDEGDELKRKQIKEKHIAIMSEMEERRKKSNDNADQRNVELDAEMRKQMREAKKSLDFVDYFFKKDGFTYIGILTQMKLDFEQRAMLALSKASEAIQRNAKRYKAKVDALKKIIPVEKEKEIEEYNYPVVLEKDCRKFEIEINDKIAHVTKFHKYALKLVLHWKYLLREKRELELLTVYEAATELLAGTMVLIFPIFVRLAGFMSSLCDNPAQSMDTFSSKYLTDQLRKMVDTISDEIGAIEESSSLVMQQIPARSPKQASDMIGKLKSQGVHAKNSLSWAIKTLGTILFHYNLLTILVQNGQYTSSLAKADKLPKPEPAAARKGDFAIEPTQKKKSDAKDFVDVFFLREGFQFIGALTKTKMTYEDKCKLALQRASPNVREMAEVIAEKIHQLRKITPPSEEKNIGEYDFPSAFIKEISEFEIDVTDKLNTIKQFHKYTVKLIDHWSADLESNVKIDPQTTYDVAIQLMAGLMALIYPILIKLANYMGKLAETPRASRTHHPPERIARKLRKMIEAVTDELGAVGAACMKTADKISGPSSDAAKDIKLKIFAQTKHAKNSVSWGAKAISPALFYYFLRVCTDQEKNV